MNPPSFDLKKARAETPGCETVLHLNHAGASLMPRPVLDAVTGHLFREAEIGGYEAADEARKELRRTYDALAALLHCSSEEIAVVENATRAWDMAFYSIPFRGGDRILTCKAEYASNYIAFLQMARRTGAEIVVIPSDECGQVSIGELERRIDDRVRLIAITHVPTNGGLVNPAAEIGRIARSQGILYLLDACQSVGQMPIDVEEIGCDLLSATGRKYLRGPRGTGFLYVRRERIPDLEPPFLDLHAARWSGPDEFDIRADARRFENWEANTAAKIGLGVAADYALSWGLEAIRDRVGSLADLLRQCLNAIPRVTVRDLGREQCGIVSFTVDSGDHQAIKMRLRAERINVSVSPAEYTRLDMIERGLETVIRASVHYCNDEQELVRFIEVLKKVIE